MPIYERFVISLAAVVLASCSSTGGVPSPTSPAASPVGESPSPVASSGTRTCVSSSEGQELPCALEPGTYATKFMKPGLSYTVPSARWGSLNREVAPGNFHLLPPGATMAGFAQGTSDAITVVSAVVPPGRCTGQPSSEFDPTYDGMVEFLRTDDHVVVSHVRDASVGGLHGTVLDIAFAEGDGCSDGTYADLMVGVAPSHGAFGISPDERGVRLYLLHNPENDSTLAIQVDDAAGGGSEYGDGKGWLGAAETVIDTFVFTP